MAKATTLLWIDKVSDKPAKAKGVITIAAGKRLSVRVDAPHSEGWVNEIVVKQVPNGSGGGTAVGFTVQLLDSSLPHHDGDPTLASVEAAYDAAALADPEMFQVIDAIVAASGATAKFRSSNHGTRFVNADQVSHTENQRCLYLTIVPDNAAGQTKWMATITMTKDIG